MARIYSNENVAKAVVECLRELGHDVLTSYEAGNANRAVSDEDVLTFACCKAAWSLQTTERISSGCTTPDTPTRESSFTRSTSILRPLRIG
jgi:hypothetical protein